MQEASATDAELADPAAKAAPLRTSRLHDHQRVTSDRAWARFADGARGGGGRPAGAVDLVAARCTATAAVTGQARATHLAPHGPQDSREEQVEQRQERDS